MLRRVYTTAGLVQQDLFINNRIIVTSQHLVTALFEASFRPFSRRQSVFKPI